MVSFLSYYRHTFSKHFKSRRNSISVGSTLLHTSLPQSFPSQILFVNINTESCHALGRKHTRRFCDDRFFIDKVMRMFLFLPTHMAAKLPIVNCLCRQHCNRSLPLLVQFIYFTYFSNGQPQWHRDTVEPRTHGVQFADDVCDAQFLIIAEEMNIGNEFYKYVL